LEIIQVDVPLPNSGYNSHEVNDSRGPRSLPMPPIQAPVSRPAPQPKQEGTIDAQIERALRRIRLLDLTAGLLGLFLLVLVYGLALIVLDAWLVVPSLVRQIAFGVLFLGSLAYLGLFVYLPLRRPLDSRYVAVQVEQMLPTAKNSVSNWIDLREQKLPAAIRGAVAGRAAKDMAQTDIDRAISARHVFWLGGVALTMFVATVVVFAVMGPSQFFSLFQRAFAPFSETTIASRTVIEVILPEGGNATVPVGQSVPFLVRVTGRVPKPEAGDAMKLLFRYSETEPVYQERVLSQGDTRGEWTYRLPAVEVNTGFFYKIVGGDFVTPEYRVNVRSGPLLTKFDVKYQHRPYLRKFFKKEFETSEDPNLRGWRGTEVTLTAHTNRVVKEGRLFIDGGKDQAPVAVASEAVPESPYDMRFRFVLEKEGLYRIRFVSQEGEHSGDSVSYKITLTPDNPPAVEITEPAEDLVLVPMNSALPLHGKIKDDYGIVDAKLRMKIKGGAAIQAKPYRNAGFRYEDGNPPTEHEYQDSLLVSELRGEKGEALKLKEGDIVEYWLEATDSCDYPEGQVGKSKVKRFKVIVPAPDKQAEQEKKQAEEQNKKADQQNNERRNQENQDRKNQANQGENKPPQPKDARNEEQKRKDEEAKKQKDDFQKEVDQKKGENKPEQKQDAKGENKDKNESKNENAQPDKNQGENKPGEQKPEPKPGDGKNDKTGSESKTGQNDKGQNNQSKNNEGKNNEGKNSQGNPDQKQGGGQGAGEKKPEPKPGNDKGAGEQHKPQNDPNGQGGNQSSKPGAAGNEPPKTGDQPKGSEHGGGGDQQPQGAQNAGQQKGGEKPKQPTGENKGPGAADKPGTGSEKKPGGAPQGNEKEGTAHPDSTESKPAANDGKPPTGEARGDNQPGKGEHRGAPGDQPKGEAHKPADGKDGPASPNGGNKGQQGEKKPATPAQTKGSGSAHPEKTPDKKPDDQAGNNGEGQQQGPRDPKNPTNDEIAQLAKDLQSKDPQKQVNAERDLRQIAQEAKDAKKREQAKEALKNAEVPGGGSPKQEDQAQKPPSTGAGKTGPEGKEDPSKTGGAGKNDGKGTPDKTGKADGGGKATDKTGDDKTTSKGSNGKGNEKSDGKGGDPATGNEGGAEGGGATGERNNQRGGPGQEAAAATPADLANKKKAAELQLEQLMKKITPEMLKERNWSEDDLKRWQQSMKDVINRDYKRDMEKLAPPSTGGSASLPNSFRKVDGGTNPPQDVQNIGKTAPPPEIRSAYQEFTQELSKDLAKKKPK
jgi:collagen type III alpha